MEEKKRIKPVIVEEDGEAVPSVDSLETANIAEATETPDSESVPGATKDNGIESTIISEESKDRPPDVKVIEPEFAPKKKGSKLTLFLIIILVLLFLGLLAGGIYVYMNGTNTPTKPTTSTPLPIPSATTTPEPSTSPTPEAKVDLSKYKVSILNGSGKIGEASKVRALLEKEGFKVTSTGNAANFNFDNTVIQVKDNIPSSVVEILKGALSKTYEVKVGDELAASSSYDIVVTVGSK